MKSEVVREKSPSGGELLELDLGACRLELLLDFLGFGLRSVLLDRLRCAFDEILRLFESETRDGAYLLDDADLVRTSGLEDNGELRLRLSGRSGSGGAPRRSGGYGSGGGHAPLAFEVLDQCGEIDDRLA